MARLKAGVIGLGMGWNHLSNYASHPDVEVVAVADRIEAKREKAKAEFNLPRIYAEGIDMIRNEKLDIISVAVPNVQHRELTIAALRSGANVLCEKPMAMNAAEAEEMLAVSREVKRKLGINFSYRFAEQSRAMKALGMVVSATSITGAVSGFVGAGFRGWVPGTSIRRGLPGPGSSTGSSPAAVR